MLGHHVYYKNSFSAWQISGHDIVQISCAIHIYKVQSCQDVVSHGPIRIPLMRFTLLANYILPRLNFAQKNFVQLTNFYLQYITVLINANNP